jgi:hypothetical protein
MSRNWVNSSQKGVIRAKTRKISFDPPNNNRRSDRIRPRWQIFPSIALQRKSGRLTIIVGGMIIGGIGCSGRTLGTGAAMMIRHCEM